MKRSALSVAQALSSAEGQINLLARSYPKNWVKLRVAVAEAWQSGKSVEPDFRFASAPNFTELRRALRDIEIWAAEQGPWGSIWAERSRELALEAEMAEQLGAREIRALAQRRFRCAGSAPAAALRRLARCWAMAEPETMIGDAIRSDDERNDASLICLMRRELDKHGWPFAVRFDDRLAAHAVADDRFVWIKPAVHLRAAESKRIVLHEVHGHVVRRVAVRSPENKPYQCGIAGADADEEGRALWLEQQAGLLNAQRRAELGRRHLAADACRQGASFSETVELLIQLSTPLSDALNIALRVFRGGGIAREIIYLDAFWRARRILTEDSDVEAWMKRGRLTLDVASRLANGTLQPLA